MTNAVYYVWDREIWYSYTDVSKERPATTRVCHCCWSFMYVTFAISLRLLLLICSLVTSLVVGFQDNTEICELKCTHSKNYVGQTRNIWILWFCGVTADGVWFDEWMYWSLIHTTRRYKHLESNRHSSNHWDGNRSRSACGTNGQLRCRAGGHISFKLPVWTL